MIEATCTACGTNNRIAEADVPAGARYVSCSNCRARVALPAASAADAGLELADLPAPRRASALAGTASTPRPPPASALRPAEPTDFDDEFLGPSGGAATGPADLPAPKSSVRPPAAPASGPAPIDLEPELPAPKRPKPPTDAGTALADRGAPAGGSAAAGQRGSIADRGGPAGGDLPAPKPRLPSMPGTGAIPPAVPPRHPEAKVSMMPPGEISDLPAPKARPPLDLPAPKAPVARAGAPSAFADLPMPKAPPAIPPTGAASGGAVASVASAMELGDLPTPRAGEMLAESGLTPKLEGLKGLQDLPAPKGFFDDLPQPAPGGGAARKHELPAPKGFFDDLPQPAKPAPPAKPTPGARSGAATGTPGSSDLPAPKGFFEDLPGKASPNQPALPAPRGFFDDPSRGPGGGSSTPPAQGLFDDLPQPSKGRPDAIRDAARDATKAAPTGPAPIDLDGELGSSLASDLAAHDASAPLDLALEGASGPALDLQLRTPEPEVPVKGQFDDLDLSTPTAQSGRSETTRQRALERMPEPVAQREPLPPVSFGRPAPGSLELEEPRLGATPALAPKQARVAPANEAIAKQRRARRMKLAAIAAAGVLALGAGGFVMYRRHAATVARATVIDANIADARRALDGSDPKHWQRAAAAAGRAVELDKTNPAALGLRAEAQYASAFADGTDATRRMASASTTLTAAAQASITGPEILRAQALQALADNHSDVAVTKLAALVKAAPNDGRLQLYLGWAEAAAGDSAAASAAFGKAATTKGLETPGLYGRGRALLAAGNLDGARMDFNAVLAIAKDHVGAQVGLAAALPASQAAQQESDLLAILQRKDLDAADPRAVTEAWVLAGDAATRSGRLSDARERYRGALKISASIGAAWTGLAGVDLRDGKLEAAAEEIGKAVALDKDDLKAQLVAAEIEIAQKAYPRAQARLDLLAARVPPPPAQDQARLQLVTGRLLEAQGNAAGAADAYERAAGIAGALDLAPTLAAASTLAALAEKAPPGQAAAYRARADKLLSVLSAAAESDAALALTLGTAYVQAGDAAKAEHWLRAAVVAHPDHLEAKFQLARALEALGKSNEAVALLKSIVDADARRWQEGIELGRAYEAAGRLDDAAALYDTLLAAQEPNIELRAHAGRLFARMGRMDRASEQGRAIIAAAPDHAAGLYLAGEGLLAAGQPAEAKKLFSQAVQADHDAQYLDAVGRAAEAMDAQSGQVTQQDAAIRAYLEARTIAPTMRGPLVALGRLYLEQHQPQKALEALEAAIKLQKADGKVAKLMGDVSIGLQDPRSAILWFEESRKLEPSAEAAYRLGVLYGNANQSGAAASAYAEAIRLARAGEKDGSRLPDWLVDAYYGLGRMNLDGNHEREAAQAWSTYLELSPKPGAQLDEVKRLMGSSLAPYRK